jgi:hypothetical protein
MNASFRSLLAVSLLSSMLVACSTSTGPPVGSYSDVTLVTENGAQDPIAHDLTPYLAKPLDFYVGDEEIEFKVSYARASDIGVMPLAKNVVICGVPGEMTYVGKEIAKLLGDDVVKQVTTGDVYLFAKEDYPSQGQFTVVFTAPNEQLLRDAVEKHAAEINSVIEGACRKRIRAFLAKDLNKDLERHFREDYTFSLDVPNSYRLNSESLDPAGVELIRDNPVRSLGIFWLDWDHVPTLKDGEALYMPRRRCSGASTCSSTRRAFPSNRFFANCLPSPRPSVISDFPAGAESSFGTVSACQTRNSSTRGKSPCMAGQITIYLTICYDRPRASFLVGVPCLPRRPAGWMRQNWNHLRWPMEAR